MSKTGDKLKNRFGLKGELSSPDNKRKIKYAVVLVLIVVFVLPKLIIFITGLDVFQPETEPEVFKADAVTADFIYLEDA